MNISIVGENAPFPEKFKRFQDLGVFEADTSDAVIVEKGMKSGRSSIMLIGETKLAHPLILQMSADALEILAGAAKGARIRWNEIRDEREVTDPWLPWFFAEKALRDGQVILVATEKLNGGEGRFIDIAHWNRSDAEENGYWVFNSGELPGKPELWRPIRFPEA